MESSRKSAIALTLSVVLSIGSAVIMFLASWTTSSSRTPSEPSLRTQSEPYIASSTRLLRHIHNTTSNSSSYHQKHRSLFLGIELEKKHFKLPNALERNLYNWNDRPPTINHSTNKLHETPLFWHILKSGGTTIKLMYATCYSFVEACETGGWIEAILQEEESKRLQDQEEQMQQRQRQRQLHGLKNEELSHTHDTLKLQQSIQFDNMMDRQPKDLASGLRSNEQLHIIQNRQHHDTLQRLLQQNDEQDASVQQWQLWQPKDEQKPQKPPLPLRIVDSGDGRNYVNVDVTTSTGIQDAADRGFLTSHLADVIFTPLLVEGATKLLDGEENRGRLFAMFRHPVDRVTSIFYYLQKATWEPTYHPVYSTWTIDDYVNSPICESNWMVRSLVNKLEGPLDPDDVKIAKEILSQKCLVGLMDRMEESVVRFHAYFGFGNDAALNCARQQYTTKGSKVAEQNSHSHPALDPNGETYALLAKKNRLDIILYDHAVRLFAEQGTWMKEQKLI
ncbi:hypothetical protein ACHAWX_004652 [Stephanocyclus meneghinianus]